MEIYMNGFVRKLSNVSVTSSNLLTFYLPENEPA